MLSIIRVHEYLHPNQQTIFAKIAHLTECRTIKFHGSGAAANICPGRTEWKLKRRILFSTLAVPVVLFLFSTAHPEALARQNQTAPAANSAGGKAEPSKDGTKVAPVEASGNVKAASERNENVFVSRLDTDALKADGARLGGDYAFVLQPLAETNYYAAEHGQPASEISVLAKPRLAPDWHAEIFESHRNSIFNARTFFQVGPVKCAHCIATDIIDYNFTELRDSLNKEGKTINFVKSNQNLMPFKLNCWKPG